MVESLGLSKNGISILHLLYCIPERLLEEVAQPAIKGLYPSQTGRSGRRDFNKVVWQDDGASIHRSKLVLTKAKKMFRNRIKPSVASPKTDDVWPSEWPWAHTEEKLKHIKIKSKLGIRREINKIWRAVTPMQCKSLISNVPLRLKPFIEKDGRRLLSRRGQNKN